MGLVVLGALVLYALISIVVVLLAIRHAKKNGKSAARWGWGAALVMYLIPFWDWLPTVAIHQYYCATEAGFWVYKTPEQWAKENPGVMETLISNRGQVRNVVGDMNNFTRTGLMNQRFVYIAKHNGPLFLHRWRYEQEIIDNKTETVLARSIDFSTSQERRQAGWSGWKFWLETRQCSSYVHMDSGSISAIAKQVEGKER
jgi:hypothetical protein